jgi:hypothetical protein
MSLLPLGPALLGALAFACVPPSVVNAGLNTGLGVGAAALERSAGGCYAVCQKGTACNHETGMCEAIPCRGECRSDEECVDSPFGERCEPRDQPLRDLGASADRDAGAGDAGPDARP